MTTQGNMRMAVFGFLLLAIGNNSSASIYNNRTLQMKLSLFDGRRRIFVPRPIQEARYLDDLQKSARNSFGNADAQYRIRDVPDDAGIDYLDVELSARDKCSLDVKFRLPHSASPTACYVLIGMPKGARTAPTVASCANYVRLFNYMDQNKMTVYLAEAPQLIDKDVVTAIFLGDLIRNCERPGTAETEVRISFQKDLGVCPVLDFFDISAAVFTVTNRGVGIYYKK